jgi:hypothetical protein
MELVQPIPFAEAIQKFSERTPIGSILRSWYWQNQVPTDLRERAFFSATVEDVRWLQARMEFLADSLAANTAVNENGERYFKAGGRAKFIEEAQKDAIKSGLGPLDPNDKGTLKDVTSETRLGLIYDVNMKSARDFGYWKQGMDPDVLNAFPASRFIRVARVKKPRPVHEANRGAVRRKDDLKFWLAMNDPRIGGFGVPWGPWGFGPSGMDTEDVGRAESDALGLTTPGEQVQPIEKDMNDNLQASTQNLDPRLVNFLKVAFGDKAAFDGDTVKWSGQ